MAPPLNQQGDSQPDPLYASPVKLTLQEVWQDLHRRSNAQDKVLEELRGDFKKLVRFIEGDNAEGTNSAKVRLDRIEQKVKAAVFLATTAVAGLIAAFVKWVVSGGMTHPPTGGH